MKRRKTPRTATQRLRRNQFGERSEPRGARKRKDESNGKTRRAASDAERNCGWVENPGAVVESVEVGNNVLVVENFFEKFP